MKYKVRYQTQDKIRIESDAIIAILSKCVSGEWHLLSSEVLDIEIENTIRQMEAK